jgi:uncharacterized integral membrane protein
MKKLGRALKWLILVPVLLVVALLSVANDHRITLHFNPLDPADSALQFDLALYQFGFAAFILGALVGAFIVWNSQRKYRRKARDNTGRKTNGHQDGSIAAGAIAEGAGARWAGPRILTVFRFLQIGGNHADNSCGRHCRCPDISRAD